jgi:2-polyprenyl-3-methyl-5-hydroxy-6-metoxy-1,4-benzoquinol methylase
MRSLMRYTCPLCLSQAEMLTKVNCRDLSIVHQTTLGFKHRYNNGEIIVSACPNCTLISFHGEPSADGLYYERLQQQPWYYMAEKPEFGVAAARIELGARVLEVGSGVGNFAKAIPGRHYVGLELNEGAVRQAVSQNRNVQLVSLRDHLRENTGSYDWVVSFQVLEHVEDVHGFISDCVNALRPGGQLALSVPNDDGFVGVERNNILNYPPHHLTRWPVSALKAVCNHFPLTVQTIEFDKLEDGHVLPYAKALILNSFTSLSAAERFHPLPAWVRAPLRYLTSALARPLSRGLVHAMRPAGHSVTVVYKRLTNA